MEQHAADFVAKRLAPHYRLMTVSKPHARASGVYRSARPRPAVAVVWLGGYNIPQGVSLSEEQQRYIVAVIYHWLVVQMNQP
ncbi:DUF4186 family protein [Escherichia coli]|nr:DUF4186 family protein [Escherichia coli]